MKNDNKAKVGSGHAQGEKRKLRVELLKELIKTHPKASRDEIIAIFQLETGTSRRTTLDYLKILEFNGLVSF